MKKYQLISILEISHLFMDHVINKDSIVVDMTTGNGHDTAYLAQRVHHVYGFDISEEAIAQTKQRLLGYNNVTLFHASHCDFMEYIDASLVQLFVFNLGYLPGSDKTITTTKQTTLSTLRQIFSLMQSKAAIQLVCYVGHAEGKEEYEGVLTYCDEIAAEAEIVRYEFLHAPTSAKIIMISKKERK